MCDAQYKNGDEWLMIIITNQQMFIYISLLSEWWQLHCRYATNKNRIPITIQVKIKLNYI